MLTIITIYIIIIPQMLIKSQIKLFMEYLNIALINDFFLLYIQLLELFSIFDIIYIKKRKGVDL